MKKLIVMFLSIAFTITLLAGCMGSTDDGDTSGKTKLSVINFRPEDQDFYEWMIDKFEEENNNIKVIYEAVDTGNYSTLMNSRFMTNSVDVYGVQPGSSLSSAVSIGRSETLNDLKLGRLLVGN